MTSHIQWIDTWRAQLLCFVFDHFKSVFQDLYEQYETIKWHYQEGAWREHERLVKMDTKLIESDVKLIKWIHFSNLFRLSQISPHLIDQHRVTSINKEYSWMKYFYRSSLSLSSFDPFRSFKVCFSCFQQVEFHIPLFGSNRSPTC